MPLHKSRPLFRSQCSTERNQTNVASGTSGSYSSPSTDKSNQAARMAQQLASQSSWADTYVPTPATTATPAESVANLENQTDIDDAPPSYEDARLERELPAVPQTTQGNVRQEPFSSINIRPPQLPQDVEAGVTTPLLCQDQDVVKARRVKQRRFIVVFLILAVWLMGIQAIQGFGTAFWRNDGTVIPPLPHRNYTRHETHQGISGTFTFYDVLDLSTTSGSINIVIDPQPSDKRGIIRVTTRSGSIKVKFTDEYMKNVTTTGFIDRVYDIEIRSSSGSQSIELPLGNGGSTSMTSDTGSFGAKFYMVHGKNPEVTRLTTQTSSASQSIKIKPTSTHPILSLAAKHYVKGSASLKVSLPPSWEGIAHAYAGGSGSVDVKGENLEFQRNGTKEIYAWRIRPDDREKKTEGQMIEMIVDGHGSIKADLSSSG